MFFCVQKKEEDADGKGKGKGKGGPDVKVFNVFPDTVVLEGKSAYRFQVLFCGVKIYSVKSEIKKNPHSIWGFRYWV